MITTRQASLDDRQAVAQLLNKKYSFATALEAEQSFINEFQQGHHFRLANDGSAIVGLISWRTQGAIHHGVAELTRLAVLSDYPDPRAVKEALFDVMFAEADFYYLSHGFRVRKIFSMIHSDARHVREFLIDQGWQQEAILRNHFHIGKDELVFSLFIA